jgi:cytochrome b pre-mRNA-processing protein 3
LPADGKPCALRAGFELPLNALDTRVMSLLRRLLNPRPDPRDELWPLWAQVVALARDPAWYRDGAVADTLEGRFDMVTAVLALVLLRMERAPDLAARTGPLTEIFVEEMDGQLRQSGVGDLMVGKQIGKLMATLGGRVGALRAALAADGGELAQAVRRNVTLANDAGAELVAERLRALAGRLAACSDDALLAGEVR